MTLMAKSTIATALLLAMMLPLCGAQEAKQMLAPPAGSGDWPCWRGPNRDGVAPSSPKLLDSWPKEGPKLLWKSDWMPAGGMASPVVADGKVFVRSNSRYPKSGGDGRKPMVFVDAEMMADWGFPPRDMPEALVNKVEETRVSKKNLRAKSLYQLCGYEWWPWWRTTKEQDELVAKGFKTTPELDTYIKDFLATLDPKDAEKYGAYIKRRICTYPNSPGIPTLEVLRKLDTQLRDKAFDWGELDKLFRKIIPPSQEMADSLPYAAFNRLYNVMDTIVCLDSATGKEIWKKDFSYTGPYDSDGKVTPADRYLATMGSASTPAVWGGKCYAVGFNGLYCLSAKDGALLWQVKGSPTNSSPLVEDGIVIYGGGGAAYDAETGKLIWKGCGCGRNSPILWTPGDKKCVLCAGDCFDLKTGKAVWKVPLNCGEGLTPAISGGILVGYGMAYKIATEKPELLWKGKGTDQYAGGGFDPAGSPMVFQDHLYLFRQWYDAPVWYCYDLNTGVEKWRQKNTIPADCVCSSMVLADGKILYSLGGAHGGEGYQVVMLQPTPEKYVQAGLFKPVGGGAMHFCSPAIANGNMYLRLMDGGMACYDLTK